MKTGIHPNYNDITVTCACGNSFVTGSTKKEIRVELCSKCHPFYTGKNKLVDATGRVDRFNAMEEKIKKASALRKGKKAKKAASLAKKEEKKKAETSNESK